MESRPQEAGPSQAPATPSTVHDPLATPPSGYEDDGWDSLDVYEQLWCQSLNRCRTQLNASDAASISRFDSPTAMLDDLRRIESSTVKPWARTFILHVAPMLELLKHVSRFFLMAMKPHRIEITIIWGLLHLLVELSLQSEARWRQMTDMFKRTRRVLNACKTSITVFETNDDMRQSLLDLFTALISLWADSSKIIREKNQEKTTSLSLESTFTRSLNEMNEIVANLQLCAAVRAAGHGEYRSSQQDHKIANVMPSKSSENSQVQFPFKHLPYNNEGSFVPRPEIGEVTLGLQHSETQVQKCYTIWGLGGIGKTQLALAYANQETEFDATLWINAEEEESLNAGFTDIALRLGLPGAARGKDVANVNLVQSWLLSCHKKWLIVFDNVEDLPTLKPYWPSAIGSILITTRKSIVAETARGGPSSKLNLKALDLDHSRNLFAKSIGWENFTSVNEDERAAADELLEELDGLPLGIRQMGGLIKFKKSTARRFLSRYRKDAGHTEKISGRFNSSLDQDYKFTLSTVWKMSFEALKSDARDTGFQVLGMMALLSPDSIPLDLFQQDIDGGPDALDDDNFEEAQDALLETGVMDLQIETCSIHRLVQTAFLHYAGSALIQTFFIQTLKVLSHAFPKRDRNQHLFTSWLQCSKYILHVIRLANWYSQLQPLQGSLDALCKTKFVQLLSDSGRYLHETGQPQKCQLLVELAISLFTDSEKGGLLYAQIVHTGGSSKFELNQTKASRVDLEIALKIREKHPDEERIGLGHTYNNLANILSAEGQLDEALELFEKAMATLEGEPAGTALLPMLIGAGRTHCLKGDYSQAIQLYRRCESVTIQVLGPEGHMLPDTYFAIGNVRRAEGRLDEAKEEYERAAGIAQHIQKYPILCAILFKLGAVELGMGDEEKAKFHLEKSMAIAQRLRSQGDVARISFKMASLMSDASEDTLPHNEKERLLTVARSLKSNIEKNILGLDPSLPADESEEAYDRLVCGFFR